MFSLATGIYQSYFAPPKLSILIIGLDDSGKTSLLERIKVTDIHARLGVTPSTAADAQSLSLPASYAKGRAVAGVGNCVGINPSGIEQEQQQQQRQQRGAQQHQEVGRPARLPPPLPPKQALKSGKCVEKMLKGGFSRTAETIEGQDISISGDQNILKSVPPPPLVESGNSTSHKPTKPPRPPRHDSISKKPPVTTKKSSSFMELLRCPSPKKYSDATLDEDEDEEYHDHPARDALEPWDTEYLRDYYIDYQEGEEFDIKKHRASGGGGQAKKMFPLDRIRPTLGQNLAKLDLSGCKCSLFDLSGAEKMRPLWERYYGDTDAIIYVVNGAETSLNNLDQSRRAFEQVCQNDALQKRVQRGLPILIFANKLDLAYKEYEASTKKANNERNGRGISWNDDEEENFVGGTKVTREDEGGNVDISRRVIDFHDLATLFGFEHQSLSLKDGYGLKLGTDSVQAGLGNVFLFGGSAKSGEGVRAAMEYLVAHAKSYHLARQPRK